MLGIKGDRKKVVKKSKTKEDKQKRLANLKEGDIMATLDEGGDNKLTLGDLFQSLDTQKMKASKTKDAVVNTNALKKQIKTLNKDNEKNPALIKPIAARTRIKQESKVNYDINSKNVTRWQN